MREEIYVEESVGRPAPSLARRVSWGAIFAGLFVTIVIQLTLTLLGAAIGAATVDPLHEQNPARGLGTGAAIWLMASALIAIWSGACIAGRLSGGPRRADGMIHGIVTWSVATIVILFLLATAAGALLGGTGALLGGAMAGNQQSQSAPHPLATIENQIRSMLPQSAAPLPPEGRRDSQQQPSGELTNLAQQDPELGAALARMEARGGAANSPQERDQALNLLTTKHGVEQQQASAMMTQWDQQFHQLKGQAQEKTREVGQVAAEGVSKGALWAFIALVLEMLIAAWGGWAGTASLRPKVTTVAAPA